MNWRISARGSKQRCARRGKFGGGGAARGPASEHIGVGMIERVGAGLLYRGLREYRRCDGRRENSGHNGRDEFWHDEHPSMGDLTYLGAARRKQMGMAQLSPRFEKSHTVW